MPNRIGNLHILNLRLNKSKGKNLFELWWAGLSEAEKAELRLYNFIPEDKEYTIKNWDEVVAYRKRYLINLFVDNLYKKH